MGAGIAFNVFRQTIQISYARMSLTSISPGCPSVPSSINNRIQKYYVFHIQTHYTSHEFINYVTLAIPCLQLITTEDIFY